jgi:hypothetical protein
MSATKRKRFIYCGQRVPACDGSLVHDSAISSSTRGIAKRSSAYERLLGKLICSPLSRQV